MTSYYIPALTSYWGDNITAVWSAELIKNCNPESSIVLDDSFCEQGKRPVGHNHSTWIKVPWAQVGQRSLSAANKTFDRIVSTHHRHNLRSTNGFVYEEAGIDKLTFIDAHGIFYRMVTEDRYPTFHPTDRLLNHVQDLKLPATYAIVHVNDVPNDPTRRNVLRAAAYFENNASMLRELSKKYEIITTSAPIPTNIVKSTHVQQLPGWVKLACMINAEECVVSLSGFTAIAAAYRKRNNCRVVNHPVVPSFNMGPPNLCYSNYHITHPGSIKKLRYMLENKMIDHCSASEYWRYRCTKLNWCQFETFDVNTFDHVSIPYDWRPQAFGDTHENCPVPLDAQYSVDDIPGRIFDLRFDKETTAIPMGRPAKQ